MPVLHRVRRALALAPILAAAACHSSPGLQRHAARPAMDVRATASDLLHCDLSLRAYELGSPGDAPPSAPVLTGDGVLVAFTRTRTLSADGAVTDLLTQRVDRSGVLLAPTVLREGVHASAPRIAAAGGDLRVVAVSGARVDLLAIDASSGGAQVDAPAVTLPFWPEDLTAGPRGFVATHSTTQGRFVRRGIGVGGSPDALLPPSEGMPEPQEQLVASGARVDLALFPTRTAVGLATLTPGVAAPSSRRELFPRTAGASGESSIAAGPSGFAVVRNGPDLHALTLFRFDAQGAPLGTPTTSVDADPSRVRRHPRVAALGQGWVVSYWDGVGPSILRFDSDGEVIGRPVEVRSGDERGGHTDARMVADERALSVSWHVHEPEFSHGVPTERPRRPGPRLGVFQCRTPEAGIRSTSARP